MSQRRSQTDSRSDRIGLGEGLPLLGGELDPLKFVFEHHRLHWQWRLGVVLGRLLGVVGGEDFSLDQKIDELSNGHAIVDANGLFDRNLECPVVAETHIAFAGGGVNVDAETANAGFSFEERDRSVAFCVFDGGAKVVDLRLKDKAFGRDFKVLDFVVLLGVENTVTVGGQMFAEVHVVAIGAKAFAIVGFDHNFPALHGL